ncbi:CHAT domain-containing protein [Saccharothrix variisporea]|uniref:CHAT domain-containing protein n=1 Tax=Saccharothrix variisporea TaxID=543527 RepID=UPI001B86AB9E|nr:CHAT domain-containing protein [Saccharothrix variisporea]
MLGRSPDGSDHALVPPYRMDAVHVRQRLVPAVPRDRAVSGEGAHVPLCSGDAQVVDALLRRIRTGPAEGDVATYGRWLFECLLAPAWSEILRSIEDERAQAVEIVLRWPAEDVGLHRLVWEAMRDDVAPLAGHPAGLVAITRAVPAGDVRVDTITGVPRVLFATSVRISDPTIRPGAMFVGLLRGLDSQGRCRARVEQGVSVRALAEACASFQPDVVHVVAHGTTFPDGRGALMLADERGGTEAVDATRLVAALAANGAGSLPTAVILSACSSGSGDEGLDDPTDASPLAAELVAAGVPLVSAMIGEISESACRLYTRRLADALHAGSSPSIASAHGRRAALLGQESPSRYIDWARPAFFTAESLDPDVRLIDPTRVQALIAQADGLKLRRDPVFIGRDDALEAADLAVAPDGGIGVIALLARESTTDLGGTRLLREIGWRMLRSGHVPLMLGPYPENNAPSTGRQLIAEIVRTSVKVGEKLGLPPLVPSVLEPEDGFPAIGTAGSPVPEAKVRAAIRKQAKLFEEPGEDLDSDSVRDYLADDFAALAAAATTLGEPFGGHSRVVLLCDDVHTWGTPDTAAAGTSALDLLLDLLDASGLGRTQRTAPVVFTGSTVGSGGLLGTWRGKVQPGYRVIELGELTPDEAVLGFQWVLLHPWTTAPLEDQDLFRVSYTGNPDSRAEWEAKLLRVGLRPTNVRGKLYYYADAVTGALCRRNDDEQVFRDYAELHKGFEL